MTGAGADIEQRADGLARQFFEDGGIDQIRGLLEPVFDGEMIRRASTALGDDFFHTTAVATEHVVFFIH